MNNVDKWKNARYLIDAKKDIDSLMFISQNAEKLNINVRKMFSLYRNNFYINASAVVDRCCPKDKKRLCNDYALIKELYYNRDKHAAHKDDDYLDKDFDSLADIVNSCKQIIKTVKNICSDCLPNEITLDFVCHDPDLYRMMNNITRDKEEKIKQARYPLYDRLKTKSEPHTITKTIFHDTEDLAKIGNKEDYCTLFTNGLTWNECVQSWQDSCIKTNVLFDKKMWMRINEKLVRGYNMMKARGYFDEYGAFTLPFKSNAEIQKDYDDFDEFMKMNV